MTITVARIAAIRRGTKKGKGDDMWMSDAEWNEILTLAQEAVRNRSRYVPQQSLLEAAKTAREVMRGKDLEHVWTNYPTEPAVTLGQMLDAAIRKCEPHAAGKE
jgi:hypothetical protein